MTRISASPGGRSAALKFLELQASTEHTDQVAVVGHSQDDVHLVMTPAAAEILARILVQHEAAGELHQLPQLEDFDQAMWHRIAVNLLAARAMALGSPTLDVVNVAKIDPGGKRRRGLELVVVGDES